MMRPLVFVLLAACGGSAAQPAAPDDTAQLKPECERTADHLVSLLKPGPTETVDLITRTFIKRCVEDVWSVDARTCFGTAASLEATSDCAPYLTVPQREAMDADIAAAFDEKS